MRQLWLRLDFCPRRFALPLTASRSARPHSAKRSSSTLARFKRSVTKLGSRGRDKADKPDKPPKTMDKSSTFAFGRRRTAAAHSIGGDGGKDIGTGSPRAAAAPTVRRSETLPHAPPPGSLRMTRGSGGGDVAVPSDAAAATAARIRLFEEGRFDVEAGLGSLTEKARRGGTIGSGDGPVLAQPRQQARAAWAAPRRKSRRRPAQRQPLPPAAAGRGVSARRPGLTGRRGGGAAEAHG